MQPGTLFYAVGASGVGKDALINGAIHLLQGTHRDELARRAITRPAGNGEDHEPVDDAEFDARLATRDLQKELFFTLGPRTAFVTDCRRRSWTTYASVGM
jgi:ribose 1,5-bisphosphokinase PhnN